MRLTHPAPHYVPSANGGITFPQTKKDSANTMNTQQQTQLLRRSLLEMARLSHRAVDYSIKGYKLGSPEFCRFVHRGDQQLRDLRQKVTDLSRRFLIDTNPLNANILTEDAEADPSIRFALSALRISTALHIACIASAEIAQHTLLSLDNARFHGSPTLDKFSRLTNRLMSLCVVALFNEDVRQAEIVLENRELAHIFNHPTQRHRRDELPIASNLKQIATQVHEMAEAIVYWLEGTGYTLESKAGAY
jgi:hypothetical protein